MHVFSQNSMGKYIFPKTGVNLAKFASKDCEKGILLGQQEIKSLKVHKKIWQMMSLNDSKKNVVFRRFLTVLILMKSNRIYTCIKKLFWLQPQARASMHEMQK